MSRDIVQAKSLVRCGRNMDANDVIPNMADRNEQAAQRGNEDEESVASSADSNINMVEWRGNLVGEKEAKALRHVFDDLQDHFGHQRPDPNVRFEANLTHPGHGDVWQADLDFTYNIKGEHCKLAFDIVGKV